MPSDFFFPENVDEDPRQYSKMAEIMASGVRGFYRGSDIIDDRGVDPSYGAIDAYELMAPIIDTDKAMHWLTSLVESKGARFVTETIKDDLINVEDSLRARFNADVYRQLCWAAKLDTRWRLERLPYQGRSYPSHQ